MNNIALQNIENDLYWVIFFLFIGIIFYLFYWRDNNLIKQDIEKIGGKLLSKEIIILFWKRSTVTKYKVRYIDEIGKEHLAICKTALLPGVYWASDSVDGQERICNGRLTKD
jgi:hypothetical protein